MEIARRDQALDIARELCRQNDAQLLYLTVFGSELYGTNTARSDLDVRGLFLPTKSSGAGRLHYSTAQESTKNSASDLDLDLWRLDQWLLKLLPDCDTGAIDLLFSPSNANCVLFCSPLLNPVFSQPQRLLNLANKQTYAEYALGQAKKYGIRGSRLGALRCVWHWLQENEVKGRLKGYLAAIVSVCGNEKYCHISLSCDGPALSLCGKIHPGAIKMREFASRVARDIERYGEAIKAAESNQGLDFKALSHAMRALDQMEELLLTGRVEFPLKTRASLVKIKNGEIPWPELEPKILKRLAGIDRLHSEYADRFNYDWGFARGVLKSCDRWS